MKIRHLYSFFADVYASFRSRALFFVRNYSFVNTRQWDKSCFTCNIIPNKRALFPFFKTSNNSAPANKIKQARFYKPFAYDKKLGFNKPAVDIADSLFVDSGICVLTVVCAICATSVQSRVSEQTHRKSPALVHKQALIKNYCFYDQTTQNYPTANSPNKHYLHFTPFHVKIITSVLMPTVNNTNCRDFR